MNRDGSGKRSLTADWDYGIDAIEWAADGRSVYAQYDDHGETKVARIGLDRGVRIAATGLSGGGLDRPYTGGSFNVSDGGAIPFTSGTAPRPAEMQPAPAAAARRLTAPTRPPPTQPTPRPVRTNTEP